MKINNSSRLLIASISLILLCFSMKGVAMSFLFGTEVVLFSLMEGKLTFEGKPAANERL